MALTQKQVSELYVAIFNRASEGSGNKFWQTSQTAAAAANDMLATTDAKAYFGTSLDSNQDFIEHIYSNTLNKTYAQDKAGIDYWVSALNAGTSRGEVVASLVAAVANYSSSTDPITKAAYDQFNNRVEVSNYMANTVEKAPADYKTSTKFATSGTTGLVVTDSASTVTTAKTSVDTLKPVDGKTFTLTTSAADVVESGNGNDTITGTTETLQSGDIIIDASKTDNDTFNLTLTAANATTPIVQNIENVNVKLDYFTGTTADLVMTNYKDSTVTLGSDKLGFNGITGATNVGGNTVKAGTGINTITVTGVTTGTLDAGSAKTVNFTGIAGAANKIVINGDITTGAGLTNTASTLTTLDVKANSTVVYDTTVATNKTTITGDKDLLLKMAATDVVSTASLVNNSTGAVNLQVTAGAALFDTTNFAVSKIIVGDVATVAATVASGQLLETNKDMTSLTIATTAPTATTATLNLGHDVATLDVKDDKLVTTINNTDANSIATLTATGEKVIVKGAGNLTVGNADVTTFDASAATGEMVFNFAAAANTSTVLGTTGKNTVKLGNVADVVSFTGQGGVDTIDLNALALTGTIAGNLGAGNDIVKIATLGAGIVALDGGSGHDILKVAASANTTAANTWDVSNFEEIQLQKTADSVVDAVAVTMNGSQLTGKSYSFTTLESLDTVALTVTANGATTDLSKLTFGAGDTVAITGRATADDIIIGTSTNDTITVAANKKTVTGGAGDDEFIFVAGNSVEGNMIKITDYQAKAAAFDNDTLNVINTDLVANKTVDVSAVGTIFADKSQIVNAVVKDGVMKLSGLSADVALANTLAEMIDIAEFVAYSTVTTPDNLAFEFGGNTYLLSTTNTDTTDLIVELTGLTGITAVGTAAADIQS